VTVTPNGGPGGDGGTFGPNTPGTTTLGIQEAINAQQTIGATRGPSHRVVIASGVHFPGTVVISGSHLELAGEVALPGQSPGPSQPFIRQIKLVADPSLTKQSQVYVRGLFLNELDYLPPAGVTLTDVGTEDLGFLTNPNPGQRGIVFDNTNGFTQYFRAKGRTSILDGNGTSGTPGDGTGQAILIKGANSSSAHYFFDEVKYVQSSLTSGSGVFAFGNGALIDGLTVGWLDVNFQNQGSSSIFNVLGTGGTKTRVRATSVRYVRWEVHQPDCHVFVIDPNAGSIAFQMSVSEIHTDVNPNTNTAFLYKVTNSKWAPQPGTALRIHHLFRAGPGTTDCTTALDPGLHAVIDAVI